jgi:hypothetical protein
MRDLVFILFFAIGVVSCSNHKKTAENPNSGLQKITVQEMVSGVEGQGSTFQFRLQYQGTDSTDVPMSLLFNGKTGNLRSLGSNNQFATAIQFKQGEKSGEFKREEATIRLLNGKIIQVTEIEQLETQYLP